MASTAWETNPIHFISFKSCEQENNAANHRSQKAERRGAFWRPSEFALLGDTKLKIPLKTATNHAGMTHIRLGCSLVFSPLRWQIFSIQNLSSLVLSWL